VDSVTAFIVKDYTSIAVKTFQDEYRLMLEKRNTLDYDERYVWD